MELHLITTPNNIFGILHLKTVKNVRDVLNINISFGEQGRIKDFPNRGTTRGGSVTTERGEVTGGVGGVKPNLRCSDFFQN